MTPAHTLLESLESFQNTYRVVLRHFDGDAKNARSFEPVLDLSYNSIRQRHMKPTLWRIAEIQRLAAYYSLSETACIKLQETLPLLVPFLQQLPGDKRRRLEKLSRLTTRRLALRADSNWLMGDVNDLTNGLTRWLSEQ